MSTHIIYPHEPTLFSRYTLTDAAYAMGFTFTQENLAVLKNLQSTIAEEKLNLEFTPNDVLTFTQQEAFKAGQLAILAHLFEEAEAAYQLALNVAQSQEN